MSITLLDGAVGTSLWAKAEAHGIKKVPVWRYNIEHPELVTELAKDYAEAGAKIILANTFGANRIAVKRTNYSVSQVVTEGVKLAKAAIAGADAKLALAAGPLTEFMEPYGDLEEEDVDEIYTEMFEAGIAAGAQCITIQTFMELEMMRVAAAAAKRFNVPVYCTMTFEKSGKTLMGNSVKDIIAALSPLNIDAIGMNCSLGPVAALPIIREFRENTDIPLMYKPNAGLPITASDGTVTSAYTPAQFVEELKPAFDFVSYIGGCCGTDASFTKALSEALK